ncbi:uncharacterized protein EI90DRAFT_3137357 [Cantharellus anzutake]|uniref:uncharacterized protein n=1 Tax=Cantharellus anzutake TaxID=1750568 RepID=UPI0019060E16|nr:uncharacterized protein EI90DRAFT_3137357 [Cantharellus anzutake]KAF8312555.1 hypothetical protein EI90DRAFT_3137357 [Cantharellus anzutake]
MVSSSSLSESLTGDLNVIWGSAPTSSLNMGAWVISTLWVSGSYALYPAMSLGYPKNFIGWPRSPSFCAPRSFGLWTNMSENHTRMWEMLGLFPWNHSNGVSESGRCHIPESRPRVLPPHHTFLTTSPSPTPCLPTPQVTFPPDCLSSGLVAAHRTLATPIPEARSRVGTFGDPGFALISRQTSDIPRHALKPFLHPFHLLESPNILRIRNSVLREWVLGNPT